LAGSVEAFVKPATIRIMPKRVNVERLSGQTVRRVRCLNAAGAGLANSDVKPERRHRTGALRNILRVTSAAGAGIATLSDPRDGRAK